MSTSLAYHTQGIVGFQHHSFQYSEGEVIQRLKRKEFRCPKCFHCSVNAHHYRTRRIQGLPYGGMKVYFEVELHRIFVSYLYLMIINPAIIFRKIQLTFGKSGLF